MLFRSITFSQNKDDQPQRSFRVWSCRPWLFVLKKKKNTRHLFGLLCDGLQREPLSGIVLNPTKEHEGYGGSFFLDNFKNIFFSKGILSFPRRYFPYSFRGIEAMRKNL